MLRAGRTWPLPWGTFTQLDDLIYVVSKLDMGKHCLAIGVVQPRLRGLSTTCFRIRAINLPVKPVNGCKQTETLLSRTLSITVVVLVAQKVIDEAASRVPGSSGFFVLWRPAR